LGGSLVLLVCLLLLWLFVLLWLRGINFCR
jgi:hypothetical protein